MAALHNVLCLHVLREGICLWAVGVGKYWDAGATTLADYTVRV